MKPYIGTPWGVVLCVDVSASQGISGRMYHGYHREGIPFSCLEQAFLVMDDFYDRMGCPFNGTQARTFVQHRKNLEKERMVEVMDREELLRKHGDCGTFIIQVQYRQHSSWQGMVTWVDGKKTVPFRSALELMKLIDSVVSAGDDSPDEPALVKS